MVAQLVLLVFSFAALLLLGAFVSIHAFGRAATKAFLFVCFSTSAWVLCNILVYALQRPVLIEWTGRFAFAVGSWPFAFVLFFFLSFPSRHPVLARNWVCLAIFLPAGILSLLALTDLIQESVGFSASGVPHPVYGPLHKLYAGVLSAYALASLSVPVLTLKKVTDPLQKAQLRLLLAGVGTAGAGVALLQLFFPAVTGTRQLPGVAPALATIFVGFAAYAIVKYRFLDIVVVIRRVIIAGCTFCGISLFLYFSVTAILKLSGTLSPSDVIGWSVTAAIAGAFLLPILNRLVQRALDRAIFLGYYTYHRELNSFARRISTIYDLGVLEKALSTDLKRIMGTISCRLFILAGKRHLESLPAEKKTAVEFFASQAARDPEVVISYEVKAKLGPRLYEPWLRYFELLEATIVVPLNDKGGLVGLLALGEKHNKEPFSVQEVDFLSVLAPQLAVVIRNSLLYHELAAMNNYMETMLEQMTCGVLTVDPGLKLVTINHAARRLLNTPPNNSSHDLGAMSPEIGKILQAALESREPVHGVEVTVDNREGAVFTVSVSATPLTGPDGDLVGVLAVLTDLTQIKQLEAEVRRVERLATVGTLAAGVAHEIKNPLVSLKTFAQLLPQKYDDPEFRTSFSQIASAEIERINSLVEQLLRFARPPKPIAVPIDVHEPLEGTLSLLATEFTKKNIFVKTHYREGPLIVHGDSEQLRQVFMNVLLNAVEALSPKGGGEIEITTGKRRRWSWIAPPSNSPLPEGYSWSDEEATIRIEDNGPGIKEAHLKYVFDPFFTTKDTGHGLGLSIAHNIVREHHGSINADNRPGGGAAFTVTLPLLETREEKQRGETHELRAGSVP